MKFIWGGSDLHKPDEYLSVKWDSERDFKQTSIDELKRRVPHHLQSWLDVAQKRHGKKGAIPTGALTRSQARQLKHLQTPIISSTLAKPQREIFSERVLFQGDMFCVQNSVRNLYPKLAKNETFNEALTGLGGHITIHQDLNNLLRKSYKSLRLVVKKAKDENEHVVRTDKIIDFLLTKKRKGRYLLLWNNSKHCIAIDANRRIIMESYQDFPRVKTLSKKDLTNLV